MFSAVRETESRCSSGRKKNNAKPLRRVGDADRALDIVMFGVSDDRYIPANLLSPTIFHLSYKNISLNKLQPV